MLGTRTKQVFAYGRRGHRVVNVYDDYDRQKSKDADIVAPKTENAVPHRLSARSVKDAPPSPSSPLVQDDSPVRPKKLRKSPVATKVGKMEVSKAKRRPPLGSIAPNAPGSPALPPSLRGKRRQTIAKVSPLVPTSPIVSLDIVLLDSQGRRVSQEHRISRADVQANVLAASPAPRKSRAIKPAPRTKAKPKPVEVIVVESDSEEEDVPVVRPRRAAQRKARPLEISDDESDEADSGSDYNPTKDESVADLSDDESILSTPRMRRSTHRAKSNVVQSPSSTPSLSPPSTPLAAPIQRSELPAIPPAFTSIPPAPLTHNLSLPTQVVRPQPLAPFSSLPDFGEAGPSRSKPRPLTPYRARPGRAIFPVPPSPPSPTTTCSEADLDLNFDFAQLALSPKALAEVRQLDAAAITPSVPAYVRPLLAECQQSTPHEFSAFIEMFPHDPVVWSAHDGSSGPPTFDKIGEASFSEVFGIGGVVLKIIPLRDEQRKEALPVDVDCPAPSDAKDVLQEIIVTKAMGATCDGFVELLKAYVVRGKYPSLLLDLWDKYRERKGSEGVRPDTFTVSQLYAIIVLPNGGPDLEACTFRTPTKTGWQQACSVFWQVARTLAEAERLVSFEHRDLHWGQILVENVKTPTGRRTRKSSPSSSPVSMDDACHGVRVTVIDLGLARMDAGHGVHWTPFDAETFDGEGDYQFDVYRMMRAHSGGGDGIGPEFRPLTNVMWLHYLVLKLLNKKCLRAPGVPRKSAAAQSAAGAGAGFTERECYECLQEVEGVLRQCLAGLNDPPVKPGRRKTQGASAKTTKTKAREKVASATGPKSAAELLDIALSRGWVL